MGLARQIEIETPDFAVGQFTRREATELIVRGCHHIHSDLSAKGEDTDRTRLALGQHNIPIYSWEATRQISSLQLHHSAKRGEKIRHIVESIGSEKKASLKEKVSSALEELITNAIYHSYCNADGTEKYRRKEKVHLEEKEAVSVQWSVNEAGFWAQVADFGGGLSFDAIVSTFKRCYNRENQIATKESGAGLGLYMVFETVTHLKIVSEAGKGTAVSCWLPMKRVHENEFSFNYFSKGGRGDRR